MSFQLQERDEKCSLSFVSSGCPLGTRDFKLLGLCAYQVIMIGPILENNGLALRGIPNTKVNLKTGISRNECFNPHVGLNNFSSHTKRSKNQKGQLDYKFSKNHI